MSNYNLQVSWSGKDALSDSDPDKVISGDDFHTEFTAVKTAVNSKANLNGDSGETFSGTILTAYTRVEPDTDGGADLGTSTKDFANTYTQTLHLNGTQVTSTAAELNILDGVTSTAAELNILDGVTSTAAELNILDGVTSTAAELNILDGVTATAAELNYCDGVTSNIQTQFSNILASPALTGTPTAPTAAADTNTTQVATTAYVQTELGALGTNGAGARTIEATTAGVPTGGSSGDITYQY